MLTNGAALGISMAMEAGRERLLNGDRRRLLLPSVSEAVSRSAGQAGLWEYLGSQRPRLDSRWKMGARIYGKAKDVVSLESTFRCHPRPWSQVYHVT